MTSLRSTLVETLLPKLLIDLPEGNIDPASLFPAPAATLWFEIGFGGGEHLAEQARQHPDINFIGCEPYINGMAALLTAIEQGGLTNVRLYDNDARLVLEKLPDNSIERLFILFPDPWPKARHNKRRIISEPSLALFYKKLKPGGLLRIATDHVDYGEWIAGQLAAFAKFKLSESDLYKIPADWVKTRYQAKAAVEGRKPMFFNGIKY